MDYLRNNKAWMFKIQVSVQDKWWQRKICLDIFKKLRAIFPSVSWSKINWSPICCNCKFFAADVDNHEKKIGDSANTKDPFRVRANFAYELELDVNK